MIRRTRTRNRRSAWLVCTRLSYALIVLAIAASCTRKPEPEPEGTNAGPAKSKRATTFDEYTAERNRAAALMGQYEYAKAVEIYDALATQEFAGGDHETDRAIATLNRQQPGDTRRALDILQKVIGDANVTWSPIRARYCAGLLLIYERRTDEAIEHLRYVTENDPNDGYAACWLGQCLLATGKIDEAEKEYRRAVEVDPYLRSGYYGLAQVLQRQGKRDDAQKVLDVFERLKDNPQARLADFKYMRMGPKAEIRPVDTISQIRGQEIPEVRPQGRIFAEPTALPLVAPLAAPWQWSDAATRPAGHDAGKPDSRRVCPSITVCDINGDGKLDLFAAAALVRDGQTANAILLAEGDKFRIDTGQPLAAVSDVRAALWGDYDNDGRMDVYLCRRGPNPLWRQDADGKWSDVTEATKTASGDHDTVDGMMFDADHDGDIDLFVVNADGPNELLSNNLDGTFRPIAAEQGIAGDGRPSRQVIAADLDNDRDLDLIVLHDEPPHDVFLNDRLWNYRLADNWQELCKTPIQTALALHSSTKSPWRFRPGAGMLSDLYGHHEVDGSALDRVEVLTAAGGTLRRWMSEREGVRWIGDSDLRGGDANVPVPDVRKSVDLSWAVADVVGVGEYHVIARHDGSAGIWSATLDAPDSMEKLDGLAECWALCNFDVATGPAIVDLPPGQPPRIWRPGPGRFPFVGLTLSGHDKKSDQMRSNASGIGAALSVRIGRHWTAVDAIRTSTAPGQSLQPLAIGTRGAKRIDFVNITWPDGVYQTEMDLEAGKLHRIEEIQRQLSSCPVLFAWNGREFAFVTDLLGVGGLGFNIGRGEYATPRPWENLLLPAGVLTPLDGRHVLKLGEPMEEVCYLDALRLVAYDLPPGWNVTLDERFGETPPMPTGRALFYRRSLEPARAMDTRGADVTELLRRVDRRAVSPGEPDRRFLGRTQPHRVTIEFAEPLDATDGEPVLILDGWIEYPYSQTMFAAWQAGAAYESATLEARGDDGAWHVVHERFGYPAGMPREMALPIGKTRLPRGTTALRLSANVEVYWDAARVAFAEPCQQARRTELPLASARLSAVGFPRRTTHAQRRPRYDYAHRAPAWDTRHAAGTYTSFGPVEPLLADVDDAVAIFGPGEEVHAEFAAQELPLAEGWSRRHVLESHGWCKDMDLFTRDGETVEPLPRRDPDLPPSKKTDALHREFNTRAH